MGLVLRSERERVGRGQLEEIYERRGGRKEREKE
jgi:hypothetical protein